MTAARGSETIALTAEVFVNQATVPLGVTVFTCAACGATRVQCAPKRDDPSGWSTAPDGSDRCPHCAGREPGAAGAE